jgi:hypothetical protein
VREELVSLYEGYLSACNEFAMYRLVDGRIAEIWVTADNARLVGP